MYLTAPVIILVSVSLKFLANYFVVPDCLELLTDNGLFIDVIIAEGFGFGIGLWLLSIPGWIISKKNKANTQYVVALMLCIALVTFNRDLILIC